MSVRDRLADRIAGLRLAPDGRPRPDAPFGQGPVAAHLLRGAIATAVAIGGRLPARVTHGLAHVGGTLEWALRPTKRSLLVENLSHAVGRPPGDPEVRRLARFEVVNEAKRSADLLWALGHRDELRATTEVVGVEHIHEALSHGRGLVLTSTHVGGWEVATAIPAVVVPVPTTVIVNDDWLAWAIDPYRQRAGVGLLYRREHVMRAASLLRDGEAVLVLGEAAYDAPRSHAVRFLDGTARLPAGVAALARLCGSPVVPFTVLPLAPRRWRVVLEPPVYPEDNGPGRENGRRSEQELLQRLADRWSAVIRAHPEHWAAVYTIDWAREEDE